MKSPPVIYWTIKLSINIRIMVYIYTVTSKLIYEATLNLSEPLHLIIWIHSFRYLNFSCKFIWYGSGIKDSASATWLCLTADF